ncbi:MAG: DUF5990 family protein [Actinomycetota bacterium]
MIHPVRLVAVDPPFEAGQGVLFGPQCRRDVEDFTEASATTAFEIAIELVAGPDGAVDFKGPYVHGRKGDRFLYLSWGLPDGTAPFVMFARAKLKLSDLPDEVLARLRQAEEVADRGDDTGPVLVAELEATNHKGQPASGTIRPPAVSWRIDN